MYFPGMLTEEDRAWFKELEGELWPPDDPRTELQKRADRILGKKPPSKKGRELLTRDEVRRIFKIVEDAELLTVLWTHGPICGIGVTVYEHELYPGTGPQELLHIADDHIPRLDVRTVYEHIKGAPPKALPEKTPGSIRPDLWTYFTRFSHSKKNREWLKHYKIDMKFDQVSYDY